MVSSRACCVPAWVILTKGALKPRDLNISVYDTNQIEKFGRNIFDKTEVSTEVAVNDFNIDPASVTVSLPPLTRQAFTDFTKYLLGKLLITILTIILSLQLAQIYIIPMNLIGLIKEMRCITHCLWVNI